MNIHFSDIFNIPIDKLDEYGSFNISLINDLPLFVDPFLLFNSKNEIYQELHLNILKYVIFLKDASKDKMIDDGLLNRWYRFPEVKQNWFGYCLDGNSGKGLGRVFAKSLNNNLKSIFKNFGNEEITKSSHIEKLTLIKSGIGRDNISDFTVNLIKHFLLEYTQNFTLKYISENNRKEVMIDKVIFNYETESWESKKYTLPWFAGDYVILTPKDILTKDENWINKNDLYDEFDTFANSIPNEELRSQINNYFIKIIGNKIKKKDYELAVDKMIETFPILIDYYIKYKENNGSKAVKNSSDKIKFSNNVFNIKIREFNNILNSTTDFYKYQNNTLEETGKRIEFFKDFIELHEGYKLFYYNNKPIKKERELQILFRLVWYDSLSDVNREVNNGGGSVDYTISKGSKDKTLVEFKLARNSHLINFDEQIKIYEKANETNQSYIVIIYFNDNELKKVNKILKELKLIDNKYIILIDARPNKLTASKIKLKKKLINDNNDFVLSDGDSNNLNIELPSFDIELPSFNIDLPSWDFNDIEPTK